MDETKTLISTPYAGTALGLSWHVAGMRSATSPKATAQGTAVSCAGTSAAVHTAQVAFGARVNALSGLPPRGAPV